MTGRIPQVSLAMTVFNEERSLPVFLESLAAQLLVPDEVVVVDGGSTDRTVAILTAWGNSAEVKVTVIEAPGANISEGRNRAIRHAQHDLIAVTDAGTWLDPRWLKELVAAKSNEVDVVSGFFEPMWFSWNERLFASVLMPLLDEVDPESFLPSSRSLLITRRAWAAAGGYPTWLDYCEDLVFDLAMKRAGMSFTFQPEAIARWSSRDTWRGCAKQYYRYARGDGKSGLWPRRHAMRFAAYALGAVGFLAPFGAVPRIVLAVGFAFYTAKFFRRAWVRRPERWFQVLRLLAGVPLVVVVGDAAKMVGYPAGLVWRLRRPRRANAA
ncbi:glycosyltransferase [Promicromonospora soli]|uniref:Glycosyl transferase n=1 Tax=Promicromonospora soli TaxID=2035533 RepID=A0A919KXJ6_9MICO|nr:glycosyltransferase [Promicromonospora soli]GHH76497.1 glycosyl transferase [Promicromonospora soli]